MTGLYVLGLVTSIVVDAAHLLLDIVVKVEPFHFHREDIVVLVEGPAVGSLPASVWSDKTEGFHRLQRTHDMVSVRNLSSHTIQRVEFLESFWLVVLRPDKECAILYRIDWLVNDAR
ncbi:hypothetical protein K458DRAFT_137127 [Lentithecium fluviatile CBS 122367]|uniref:Secreted protein n=1 Tax=Lentithecium fluviatile CBS 122367 TaxID=1168545 RepID=A0A6G1IJZ8_9PLEO|nr:hypothetical protein K458DRAFT_137127 [Lentithecium fluviatile CBS 122367]